MRKIATICLCMAILLSGCGKQKQKEQPPVTPPSVSEQKKKTEDKQREKGVVEQLCKLSETGEIVAAKQNDNSLLCVQRKEDAIKLVILDVKTGKMIEKKLSSVLLGRIEIEQTGEHIVLYDQNRNIIIMNQDLEIVDSLTIKNKVVDGVLRNYCVLPGSKKIVYFKEVLKNGEWYQEVNECDYSGKNKKQICRIEDVTKSVGKVNQLTQILVGESERALFFCGLYYKTANEDETSIPCFGVIELETGKITAVQEEKIYGQLMKNKMMFVDGLKEKGKPCSGYVTCLNENGEQEKYTFRNRVESQEVMVSDKETYYLSYEKRDEGSTEVTCYSFAHGEYQWEKKVPHYVAALWYFEEPKMLLYSYYDDNHNLCFKKEDAKK